MRRCPFCSQYPDVCLRYGHRESTMKAESPRPWDDYRNVDDAPSWYGVDEASAWASGYMAAVENYTKALNEALAREQGRLT